MLDVYCFYAFGNNLCRFNGPPVGFQSSSCVSHDLDVLPAIGKIARTASPIKRRTSSPFLMIAWPYNGRSGSGYQIDFLFYTFREGRWVSKIAEPNDGVNKFAITVAWSGLQAPAYQFARQDKFPTAYPTFFWSWTSNSRPGIGRIS